MVSSKVPYNKDAILKYKMGYHGKKAEKTETKKKRKSKGHDLQTRNRCGTFLAADSLQSVVVVLPGDSLTGKEDDEIPFVCAKYKINFPLTIMDFTGKEMTIYRPLVLPDRIFYNHFIIGSFWYYRLCEVLRQSCIAVD